jgi:capsid protein
VARRHRDDRQPARRRQPVRYTLTQYPTDRSAVAFPTASPDRPAWVPEGSPVPVLGLGDDANIVGVAKLAEIILLSSEAVSDTSVNLTQQVGELLTDSASAELDRGLLYGSGSAGEPQGVVAAAPAVDGTDLAAAITAAIGSIGDAGGAATHLAGKPSILAKARNTRATGSGDMLFPDGIGAAFGLTEAGVPELHDMLVYDSARAYLVIRNDFEVAISQDYAFNLDSLAVRVRGRFAAGVPAINKTIRKVTVGGAAPTAAERRERKAG